MISIFFHLFRLSRRVIRDMSDYNRPLEQILNYYQKYVKPAFEEFCLPTKKYADVIIPRGVENLVAINLIVQHINDYLTNSSNVNFNLNYNNNINNDNNSNSNSNQNSPILNENKSSSSSKLFDMDNKTSSLNHKITSPSTSKASSSSNSLSSLNNQLSISVVGHHNQSQMNSPGTPSKRSERPH